MTCPDCTRARAGIWGGYMAECESCIARGVARSLAAFDALDPHGNGDKEALRALIGRTLRMPADEARAAVWEWWLRDREVMV